MHKMGEVKLGYFHSRDNFHYIFLRRILSVCVFYLLCFSDQVKATEGENELKDSAELEDNGNSTADAKFLQFNFNDFYQMFPNTMKLRSESSPMADGFIVSNNETEVPASIEVNTIWQNDGGEFMVGANVGANVDAYMDDQPSRSVSVYNAQNELVYNANPRLKCGGAENELRVVVYFKIRVDLSGDMGVFALEVSPLDCKCIWLPYGEEEMMAFSGVQESRFDLSQHEQELSEKYLVYCRDSIEYYLKYYMNPELLESIAAT